VVLKTFMWRWGSYRSNSRPIIIGGCSRSGTTLMRVILDTHSQICCGPESNIFRRRFMLHSRHHLFYNLSRKFDLSIDEILQICSQSRSQGEFIDLFYKAYCRQRKKPNWADKRPANMMRVNYIFKYFPKAKFVHMIRDGRDAICSLRTHPHMKIVDGKLVKNETLKPLGQCVRKWVTRVQAGIKHRGDPRYCEIRYEDLVLRPEPTLKSLLQFIGYKWEDRLLSFHEIKDASRDPTRFAQNPEATQPLSQSSLARWRRDLNDKEVEYVNKHAGPLLIELGYEK
jgi:protein-tyrosine sulfotransferase